MYPHLDAQISPYYQECANVLHKFKLQIRLKAPVDREREDYKTFTGIKLPMSEAMSDADLEK